MAFVRFRGAEPMHEALSQKYAACLGRLPAVPGNAVVPVVK